jgi:hypothetical protein
MKQQFEGWQAVARGLRKHARVQRDMAASGASAYLDAGQCDTLCGIAERIADNGMIIADEVGMGKTRIATTLVRCVVAAGGRVAMVIPPGLGYQWQAELYASTLTVPDVIRGLPSYYRAWHPEDQTRPSVVPVRPWYEESALLISHAFGHWRLREGSERTALLPELFARWRIRTGMRSPNNYDWKAAAPRRWGGAAAIGIVNAVPADPRNAARIFLDKLVAEHTWPQLHDGEAYRSGGTLRGALEYAVGLGFGMFDLVIIDEAHKGRQIDSRLSVLLDKVLLCAPHVRKVGLTATPVELEAEQWWNTLARIGVSPAHLGCTINGATDPIRGYAEAVQGLRTIWRSSASAREAYRIAASRFQQALTPYLLRRDKRRDRAVMAYAAHSGQQPDRYRNVDQEIVVDPATLGLPWKRAICAAEALSVLLSRQSDKTGGIAQRLRLTIGNGHGIASLLDHVKDDDALDGAQHQYDGTAAAGQGAPVSDPGDDKRLQRADWWQQRIVSAFAGDGDTALFHHPAICAAVARIEEVDRADEKVLVFGRFTRPMQALTSLLNAREMLRRLERGAAWPQAKVHGSRTATDESSDWPVVRAAWRQRYNTDMTTADERELDDRLDKQYRVLERDRQEFREQLLDRLEAEFSSPALPDAIPGLQRGASIIAAFRSMVTRSKDGSELATVARALTGLLSEQALGARQQLPPGALAQAFLDLIRSATSRDLPDSEEQAEDDGQHADALWATVMAQLHEEYSGPRGGFARLMNGNTRPETRRLLQLAFNRKGSFPHVLVAQSLVGREGLNLHLACRTVVLLHPEWNPGVVEQQIGRVDRVGSYWSRQLDLAIENDVRGADLPRIDVHPVMFGGTYDAENWRVLRERWDDLRAQLHGVPVPARLAGDDAEASALIAEINAMAPNFAPPAMS